MRRSGNTPSNRFRIPGLDVLRFVAVMMVMGRHFLFDEFPAGAIPSWAVVWKRGGWAGVDLFFVLSGFLVGRLIIQEWQLTGDIKPLRFLIRRALKLYPAFWLFLTVFAASLILRGRSVEAQKVLAELLFVQNYFPRMFGHTWSLAVEEHFYLLFVMLAVWIVRRNRNRSQAEAQSRPLESIFCVPLVYLLLVVGCGACRVLSAVDTGGSQELRLLPTHHRMDSLFCGVAVAWWFQFRGTSFWSGIRTRISLAVLSLICFVVPFLFSVDEYWFVSAIWVLPLQFGSAAAVMCCLVGSELDVLLMRVIRSVGRASYSAYLWHMVANTVSCKVAIWIFGSNAFTIYCLLYVVATCVLGIGLSHLVEYPVLRLRDRWFPAKTASV